jgi:hypothetical protein
MGQHWRGWKNDSVVKLINRRHYDQVVKTICWTEGSRQNKTHPHSFNCFFRGRLQSESGPSTNWEAIIANTRTVAICSVYSLTKGLTNYGLLSRWYSKGARLEDSTRCDNLIPGMDLRKQHLLTRALAAAPVFEIPSLRSHALCETMVPLPETVWKIVSRKTSQ